MRLSTRIVLSLVLFLTIMVMSVSRVDGASAPISQADYWTLVEQTQKDIRALKDRPADQVRLALDGMAVAWTDVTEVQLTDGSVVPVDVSFLVSLLKADPPNLEQLDGLLGALLAAHKSYSQHIYDASNPDALNAILLRPEFQWRPNPVNDWLQKIWDKIAAWLDKIFNVNISIPGGGTATTTIAVIVLLLVLAYVFRGLFTDLVKESTADSSAEDSDLNLTSETAFRKAQNLSGQGDYRTAVRYLYLSSLLLMEERGILRYDRSRTNREYLRSVSSHPNLANPLKSVVDVFDRVWYGYEALDETTYKQYVDEVEELKEQKQ
jgi:hypothetical protein